MDDQDKNPFDEDLKSEFEQQYNTSPNAVSQLFNQGGFFSDPKVKIATAFVAVLLLGGGGYWLSQPSASETPEEGEEVIADGSGSDDSDSQNIEDQELLDLAQKDAAPPEPTPVEEPVSQVASESVEELPYSEDIPAQPHKESYTPKPTFAASGVAPTLLAPQDGASVNFDAGAQPPELSWEGGSSWVVLSHNAEMSPVVFKSPVRGGVFKFHKVYPGEWYWQVQNNGGKSEVRRFSILPPRAREVVLVEPKGGTTVSGSGGVISWQGDANVSYYRVEFSQGNIEDPRYRFATSATNHLLENVDSGQYQLRIGALSETSSRWEYTAPIEVSVE